MSGNQPRQFIIEGVDRLGKSTLIEGLLQELGYRPVIHFEKPRLLKAYADDVTPLASYQYDLYDSMFWIVHNGCKMIFDRGHLGEVVYAPRYRNYPGEYVFSFERLRDTSQARLVLLTTSDFSFVKDDGLSLDFARKEEEQAAFVAAFHASSIEDKMIVDVSDGRGGFRSAESILAEVLRK